MIRSVAAGGGVRFGVTDGKDGFWDRFEEGRWEPETLSTLRRLVRPGLTLLDIGAWIGPISLTAAALGARVVAFEPDPRAFELLRGNLAANPGFRDRVSLHPLAVAPERGRLDFGSPKKPGDSMGSVLLAGRAAATWQGEAITPADVLDLAGPGPRVVKIDIEGAEYDLLPRCAPLLDPDTRAVLLALHPKILGAAGEGEAAIRARTAQALSALAGYTATSGPGGTEILAENATLVFERPA